VGGWILTGDGVRLPVRRWVPRRARATAVVVVHGFGATKDDASVVALAEALSAAGHRVLAYTARGHGDAGGLCTLGDLERHDVAAAADLARADADRVVLVGTSMGAIAVLRHAAEHPVDGVVTVSSPAEWRVPRTAQSAAAAVLTRTPPGRWAARRFLRVRLSAEWSDPAPPVELAAALQAPLAVIHGLADRFIDHGEASRLHAAAAGPRRLDLVPGMGHAYRPESIPVIDHAVRWALGHGTGPDGDPVLPGREGVSPAPRPRTPSAGCADPAGGGDPDRLPPRCR
jgi:pimeloyl-ACP methyl ester carboxylesterase